MELKNQLLLHSCCAPCSTVAIERLNHYYDITVYYYNPNIYPRDEYEKRKIEQINFIKNYNIAHGTKIEFLDEDYEEIEFQNAVKGYENEPEMGQRCDKCIELRLKKTSEKCKMIKIKYFATTLSVSPHKDTKKINEIGIRISKTNQTTFIEENFKDSNGFKESVEISKDYLLYRQKYCGCKYSIRV